MRRSRTSPANSVVAVVLALTAATFLVSAVASSQAVFDVGGCAGRSGADAVRCLEARCNGEHSDDRSRDLDACVALGWRFACGEDVEVDAASAMDRFSRACDNGHASGCAEYEQLRSLVRLECSTASSASSGTAAGSGTGGLNLGEPCTSASVCASGFCGNGRCAPEGYSYIPAGTFTMGSPVSEEGRDDDETQHTVTLSHAFFLQQTEVTQGQWRAVAERYAATGGTLGVAPSRFAACGDDCPVERVSWYDAVQFANALSALEGLTRCYVLTGCTGSAGSGAVEGDYAPDFGTGDFSCDDVSFVGLSCDGYRLPTESEWEYAARAGTTTATYAGNLQEPTDCDIEPGLESIGWYCGNSSVSYGAAYDCSWLGGSTSCGPREVALRATNGWGLHDMLGNVWEWCWDWYGIYPGTAQDPTGASSGSYRVLRGGSWINNARLARAAYRANGSPGGRDGSFGFRLARSVP